MKTCNVCGKENADDARFCKWCGIPIVTDEEHGTTDVTKKVPEESIKRVTNEEHATTDVTKKVPEEPIKRISPVTGREEGGEGEPSLSYMGDSNTCPSCEAQINNWDNYCGKCGNRLSPTEQIPKKEKRPFNKKLLVIGLAAVAVVIGGFAIKYIIKTVQAANSHYIARFQDETGKWGYMDEHGNVVVDCKYDEAYDFSEEGYATVGAKKTEYMYSDNVHYGVIDSRGTEVVLCQNTYVGSDYIDRFGYCPIEQYDDWYEIYYDGVANTDGTTMINHDYNIFENIGDSKLFIAYYSNAEVPLYGVINELYEWILEPQYYGLQVFKDEDGEPIKINGEYCLIAITDDSVTGLIDINGNIVLPFNYNNIENNCNIDHIRITDRSDHIGVINSSFQFVHDCVFDYMSAFNANGKAFAQQDDYTYLIDADGGVNELGYRIWGYADQNGFFCAWLEDEGKYGVMDEIGSWIIQPKYNDTSVYSNYITVNNDDQNYLLNLDGDMISSEYTYYEIGAGIQDAIPVYDGSYYGVIDKNGNEVVECYYDDYSIMDGWINLYDVSNPRGILINPEGEIVSDEYTRYFVSSDGEYITAWTENNWNDYSSDILVQSAILNSDGSVKKQFDEKYTVGAFLKVR